MCMQWSLLVSISPTPTWTCSTPSTSWAETFRDSRRVSSQPLEVCYLTYSQTVYIVLCSGRNKRSSYCCKYFLCYDWLFVWKVKLLCLLILPFLSLSLSLIPTAKRRKLLASTSVSQGLGLSNGGHTAFHVTLAALAHQKAAASEVEGEESEEEEEGGGMAGSTGGEWNWREDLRWGREEIQVLRDLCETTNSLNNTQSLDSLSKLTSWITAQGFVHWHF